MIKKLKNEIIKKLGGYTYDDFAQLEKHYKEMLDLKEKEITKISADSAILKNNYNKYYKNMLLDTLKEQIEPCISRTKVGDYYVYHAYIEIPTKYVKPKGEEND